MKGKLVFAAGAAVGYVLGARAGRKRYEQIKSGAEKFWNSPGVQERVKQVQGFVDDRAPDIQSKVADASKKVVDQVTKRTGQRGSQKGFGSTGSGNGSATTGATTSGASGAAGSGTVTSGAEQAGDRPAFE